MNYIHQIIDSNKLVDIFDLPVSLKNRTVEVIILPMPIEIKKVAIPNHKVKKSSFGCLKEYADKSLIPTEDGAWERAVKEKYENS